jgi:hypothetical protein
MRRTRHKKDITRKPIGQQSDNKRTTIGRRQNDRGTTTEQLENNNRTTNRTTRGHQEGQQGGENTKTREQHYDDRGHCCNRTTIKRITR